MVSRVVVDTNIVAVGYLDREQKTAEFKVLQELQKSKYALILSPALEQEIHKLLKRLEGKDIASRWISDAWHVFEIETISGTPLRVIGKLFNDRVPRKDLAIFSTAVVGGAKYLISNNRAFLKESSMAQNMFKCYTPKEFLEEAKKNQEK